MMVIGVQGTPTQRIVARKRSQVSQKSQVHQATSSVEESDDANKEKMLPSHPTGRNPGSKHTLSMQ